MPEEMKYPRSGHLGCLQGENVRRGMRLAGNIYTKYREWLTARADRASLPATLIRG